MNALWILCIASLVVFVVDGKKDRNEKLKRWEHWNQIKKPVPKQPNHHDCSVLPARLLDWFHILRYSHIKQEFESRGIHLPRVSEVVPRMRPLDAKMPFPSGFEQAACREPIKSVFHNVLDQNKDGTLDNSELADVYEISSEPCIKEFFKKCAKGKDTFTEAEFCSCFASVEPPCSHNLRKNPLYLLIRGEPRPINGVYNPSCDQDGFYLPRQCRVTDNQGTKECWCVDRYGSKIEGLTECVDNTEPPEEEGKPDEPDN